MAPQPISVGTTGTFVISANSSSKIGRIGIDDAAARHDQRALRGVEHAIAFWICLRVAAGL